MMKTEAELAAVTLIIAGSETGIIHAHARGICLLT
jgi:hypothetical protein